MADASTNAPALSRKPCSKRLSGQKETDQTSTHCINVWSNYGPSDRVRTCGLMVPNHPRYQLRYTRIDLLLLWARCPVSSSPARHAPRRRKGIILHVCPRRKCFLCETGDSGRGKPLPYGGRGTAGGRKALPYGETPPSPAQAPATHPRPLSGEVRETDCHASVSTGSQ